jgi:hypothetical protein
MVQELFTLPEHSNSPPVFEGICVAPLNFPVFAYIDYCFFFISFLYFPFTCFLSIVIYDFFITSWYLLFFFLFVYLFLFLFLYIYFFICQRTNSLPSILSVMLDRYRLMCDK